MYLIKDDTILILTLCSSLHVQFRGLPLPVHSYTIIYCVRYDAMSPHEPSQEGLPASFGPAGPDLAAPPDELNYTSKELVERELNS